MKRTCITLGVASMIDSMLMYSPTSLSWPLMLRARELRQQSGNRDMFVREKQ